ncbi:hypothetical protein STENM327S_08572 [Streptomyces tendae]
MSLEPAIAALAGFLVLDQALAASQAAAIALVVRGQHGGGAYAGGAGAEGAPRAAVTAPATAPAGGTATRTA